MSEREFIEGCVSCLYWLSKKRAFSASWPCVSHWKSTISVEIFFFNVNTRKEYVSAQQHFDSSFYTMTVRSNFRHTFRSPNLDTRWIDRNSGDGTIFRRTEATSSSLKLFERFYWLNKYPFRGILVEKNDQKCCKIEGQLRSQNETPNSAVSKSSF